MRDPFISPYHEEHRSDSRSMLDMMRRQSAVSERDARALSKRREHENWALTTSKIVLPVVGAMHRIGGFTGRDVKQNVWADEVLISTLCDELWGADAPSRMAVPEIFGVVRSLAGEAAWVHRKTLLLYRDKHDAMSYARGLLRLGVRSADRLRQASPQQVRAYMGRAVRPPYAGGGMNMDDIRHIIHLRAAFSVARIFEPGQLRPEELGGLLGALNAAPDVMAQASMDEAESDILGRPHDPSGVMLLGMARHARMLFRDVALALPREERSPAAVAKAFGALYSSDIISLLSKLPHHVFRKRFTRFAGPEPMREGTVAELERVRMLETVVPMLGAWLHLYSRAGRWLSADVLDNELWQHVCGLVEMTGEVGRVVEDELRALRPDQVDSFMRYAAQELVRVERHALENGLDYPSMRERVLSAFASVYDDMHKNLSPVVEEAARGMDMASRAGHEFWVRTMTRMSLHAIDMAVRMPSQDPFEVRARNMSAHLASMLKDAWHHGGQACVELYSSAGRRYATEDLFEQIATLAAERWISGNGNSARAGIRWALEAQMERNPYRPGSTHG